MTTPVDVETVPRREFVQRFASEYQRGQHVTFIGPSGRGKTKLAGQLVIRCTSPAMQGVILHGKIFGRDKTVEHLSRAGDFRIVSEWPPGWRPHDRKSRGWILLPLTKPGETVTEENAHLQREFRKAIRDCYHSPSKRPRILMVDEAHQAHTDLKLKGDCEGPLMRGRPDCAVWSLVQRGRYVSYMVYDQAEHVFIFYDPDVDNQRRYSEIGGVDSMLLRELSAGLKTRTVADGSTISECLYFRRSGDVLCIVGT